MTIKYTMRQAADMIDHAIRYPLSKGQHRVVYLEGDPGIGKTAMMRAAYNKHRRYRDDDIKAPYYRIVNGIVETSRAMVRGFVDNVMNPGGFTHFIPYVAPEREPTDWGLPMPNADRTAVTMLPLDDFLFDKDDRPFIFLDEIDKANNMMQNVLGRVMHEQRVGNIIFPEGTFVAAAGNAMTNRAGSMTANTHIKNRRTHVPLTVAAPEWIEEVGIPFDLHSSVVSYIRTDGDALHKFDAGAPSFPSPRSWTKVGMALNHAMPEHVERAFIEGDIGVEASNAFWGHLQIFRELRSPELIIKNPKGVEIPNGKKMGDKWVTIMWCEVTALAKYADQKNCEAIFTYFDRLPGEYGFIGFRDTMQRDKKLIAGSTTGQAWFIKNATMLKSSAA